MSEVDNVTRKAVEEGGLLALLYFDIHGSDKDTLIQLATGFVQKILKEKGVVFAKAEIDEPLESEGLFSTSLELKVLSKDVESMARLCANFCPFSLEILEPQEFRMPIAHMQDLLMFVASNSHDYKKYILEKVSPPEQQEAYKRNLRNRAEIGKRILERKKV
jgi:hypothetical protein